MPTRALSEIHEVIFNNPEGGARGVIEYYRVYFRMKPACRHALAGLYPGNHQCATAVAKQPDAQLVPGADVA